MRRGTAREKGTNPKAIKAREYLFSLSKLSQGEIEALEEHLKHCPYEEYLESDYWKAIAWKAKWRDDWTCRLCGEESKICAHHLSYRNRGRIIWGGNGTIKLPEINDLVAICRDCHRAIEHLKRVPGFIEFLIEHHQMKVADEENIIKFPKAIEK